MADFTYDPGLVIDDTTGAPVPNAIGELRETPEGAAVAVYDLNGVSLPGLATNAAGVCQRFSADISVGFISFGSVPQRVASDQQQEALPAAEAAQAAAEDAAAAAQALVDQFEGATIPTTPADIGAMPANIRRWTSGAWSARPTVPAGYSVESYSDGSYGSTYDPAATAPPNSQLGDGWTKA